MWSSRLFWKLFVSYAALNLVATLTFVLIVAGWQQKQVVDQVTRRLHNSTALVRSDVRDMLSQGRTTNLQAYVVRLGEEIDTRITLVSMDGIVLADSKRADIEQLEAMENHKDRVELVRAAAEGSGSSERASPTLGEPMLYYALRVDEAGQPTGLVRTALPMTAIRRQVARIQGLIWLVAALVSLAAVGLTYFVAARTASPVRTLTQAAEAIAAGDYQHRVYAKTMDELGTLAKSFNRMSDRLAARESELRESSQRLAAVLEGMVEGVIALDDQERIVLANAAAGQLLGFAPTDAVGAPLLEVVRNHPLHEAMASYPEGAESRQIEIEVGESEKRIVAVTATQLLEEPTSRFILVLQDVTELRNLESLRQEFAANVSHELKTPLSSIKAYAETLINGALDDQENNKRFVQRIEEQADRLYHLIMDLLSLARIETGQQAFDISSVRVADVLQSCIGEQRPNAKSKNIVLAAEGSPVGLEVQADEEGTRQIFDNLIDNAVKYTPAGGGVHVTWWREGGMGVIEVRDTGIGIAAEHLPRLFERFYRVDKARSRELGGTGLGLSIVKHLAQSFGGSVQVTCPQEGGTVFTVRLPCA